MYAQFQTEYQPPGFPEIAQQRHQPKATDLIGQPILFASGQFTGQTIRAELREIQQADLGRKYVSSPLTDDSLADDMFLV
jgi:hypothetical protein